jgi:hypothetical protein
MQKWTKYSKYVSRTYFETGFDIQNVLFLDRRNDENHHQIFFPIDLLEWLFWTIWTKKLISNFSSQLTGNTCLH